MKPLQKLIKTASPVTTVSRIMFPSHANPAGNVHGGTIMKMIDEAGSIAAMRYCNRVDGMAARNMKPVYVALARIDQMNFKAPIHVGEVAIAEAQVTYTSKRSIEVSVSVFSENFENFEKKCTNNARVWYVPVEELLEEEVGKHYGKIFRTTLKVSPEVEQIEFADEEKNLEEEAKERYIAQKKQRQEQAKIDESFHVRDEKSTMLAQLMLPDDCNKLGSVQGGVILKLIDNAAGIVAFKHTRTNVVTALIEAVDFVRPITLGQLIEVDAKLVFTSAKSMEIKVDVYAEDIESSDEYLAATASLIFVGLDGNHRPVEVRQIPVPEDKFLKDQFMAAKRKHEERRNKRMSS